MGRFLILLLMQYYYLESYWVSLFGEKRKCFSSFFACTYTYRTHPIGDSLTKVKSLLINWIPAKISKMNNSFLTNIY